MLGADRHAFSPPRQRPGVENFHRVHIPPPVQVAVPVENGPPEHVKFPIKGDQTGAGVLELRRERQLVDDEPGVGRLPVALDPARGKTEGEDEWRSLGVWNLGYRAFPLNLVKIGRSEIHECFCYTRSVGANRAVPFRGFVQSDCPVG